ncbi:MAG: class I SAM-dependent methyltransferase, partial [Chloroflexi bacterium]|nr:class I SAM-dependent methyltransferase [Chloroflexota bacterium]
MSTHNGQRRERPGTYFVQDRSNQEEMTRLQIQGQMFTAGMGGVLPEQPDPTGFRRILDVGCGTGDWLIQAAKTYPDMSRLVGIDISSSMLDYARAQAAAQQENHRVEFAVMDALLMLEFPSNSFDLVNQRLGMSYLRTWDWAKLLEEMQRVTKRNGVIRITESNIIVENNSPALSRLYEFVLPAIYRAGHLFEEETTGLTAHL